MNPTQAQEPPTFKLGNEQRDYVEVRALDRAHPERTDYDDGNWLVCEVQIAAGPWTGSYRASLRAEEFAAFRAGLQTLYENVDGPAAVFDSMEPWLTLEVRRTDRSGHVEIRGKAQCEPFFNDHNVLSFVLELDQSYLPSALAGLTQIETIFPVVGSR